MSFGGERYPKLFSIVVVGGQGSITMDLTGQLSGIAVKSPSPTATYDLEILDVDGFGIGGEVNVTGNSFLVLNGTQGWGNSSINITNATNGTYQLKVIFIS